MDTIRNEFNDLINKHGHRVLLLRSGRERRCSCWNEKTSEASKDCNLCFGLGYTVTVEQHLARAAITSIPETLSRAKKTYDFGSMAAPSRVFYFKRTVKPKVSDLIIDCEFDIRNMPILDNYSVYEIGTVDLLRGEGGDLSFVKTYCGLETINMEIIFRNVRKKGIDVVYDLGVRR